jgi:hypothetical protein
VGLNLLFSNGQTASVSADGDFTVYRPTAEITSVFTPFFFTLSYTNPITCKLKLGNNEGDGVMFYFVGVHSKFYGNFDIIQLITAHYSNPVANFSDERLDGSGVYASGGIAYDNGNFNTAGLNDGPSMIWEDPNTVSISARDFVQFCPDGGISVTLGIVTWNASATARQYSMFGDWFIQNPTISGPTGPNASDEFPVWTNTYP